MGKIKKARQKLHLKAVQFEDKESKASPLEANESILPAIFPTAGLFNKSNTEGTPSHEASLQGSLTNEKRVSKAGKRKERHERFLKKLHATRLVEEGVKKAEKRAKTVIVGDMEPLLTALPTITIPDLTKGREHGKSKKSQEKSKVSKKARHKLQLADIDHFQQVLKHPAYQSNPMAAISEHIKNAIQRENELQTG